MVMASAGTNMPGGGDGSPASAPFSSAPGCRMRKRRRLAPPAQAAGSSGSGGGGAGAGPSRDKYKRVRPASPSTSSSSQPSDADSGDGGEQGEEGAVDAEEEEELPQAGPPPPPQQQQVPASAAAQAWPVAFGSLSVAGRSRDMEDTVSLRPGFCTWADGSPMHFFAVFDGHGGSHVAELCRDRMHEFLAEELAAEAAAFPQRLQQQQQQAASAAGEGGTSSAAGADAASSSSAQQQEKEEEEEEERAWRAALSRAFRRVDALASRACACGRVASPPCRCPLSGSSGIVGSTAVVAVLVRGRVVVANCGDSRAVLCRRRAPVPLSDDHKPNRPDELARIQAAGGRVVFNNGHRVRGILAMSRALGDRMLRPEVIAEPEITVTDRTPEDECLILASDGMWDAVPNEIACSVARQCLQDGNPATAPVDDAAAASGEGVAAAGPEPAERCSNAASLLVRLAFGRDSWDNISVVVIDLQRRQ